MPDVDFSLLDVPRETPVGDAQGFLRAAMAWHFGEQTGSAFWLRAAKDLPFDPVTDIDTFEDLRRFPNLVNALRSVPVEDLIPRGYGSPPPLPQIFESGGTTGAPKRTAQLPDWVEQVTRWQTEDFTIGGFVRGAWLSVPHAERATWSQLLLATDLRAPRLDLPSHRPRPPLGEEVGHPQGGPRGGRIRRPCHRAGQVDSADPEHREHAYHPAATRRDRPQRCRCGPDQPEDPLAAPQWCARRPGHTRRAARRLSGDDHLDGLRQHHDSVPGNHPCH